MFRTKRFEKILCSSSNGKNRGVFLGWQRWQRWQRWHWVAFQAGVDGEKKRFIENFCRYICIELFYGTNSAIELGYFGVRNESRNRKRE
jgi:hypothetical protein